ncbi:acetate/propionate family kinase [Actinoalloteichus hoggarensis]|uniref:acetate/propionate family kinase n=1 Tax=Actinoalloteichus hoggarensis TaxID=1470176 RepID=UPI0028931F93|nr:acetate kinase [Actinoalloteichus hoggarensis]
MLTVNAGSSSLRVHVVDAERETVLAERGVTHPPSREETHALLDDLLGAQDRSGAGPVDVVAHRLVHGGAALRSPVRVDDGVLRAAWQAAPLAPSHVPTALRLLEFTRDRLPEPPQVLCPDTAFHAGLPAEAATYALPARWRDRYGLRRYGFHGLSYRWAVRQARRLLPGRSENLLLAHLGGGASVCAVRGGRSVDTSMGFTPLEGLAMTTRSGSVDPGMLLWLLTKDEPISPDDLSEGLYHRSGLLGLSNGRSADTRDLVRAAEEGDEASALALAVFAHRGARELAACATSLERVDALVFTGEIGWDQPEVRTAICARLGVLGLPGRLAGNRRDDGAISPADAAVPVLVVRAREELSLASEAVAALGG